MIDVRHGLLHAGALLRFKLNCVCEDSLHDGMAPLRHCVKRRYGSVSSGGA